MKHNPTDREMEILKVLWELGECSVREVHEPLNVKFGLHFNTIQTQLRIMDGKGLVSHRPEGRAFLYKAKCTREQVSSQFLHKVFDGALDQLVLSMLSSEHIKVDELKELEQVIADARKQNLARKSKGEGK